MKAFKINGYFKHDKSEFENYIVCEQDSVPEGLIEEDIFYFGLNETSIKEIMSNPEEKNNMDFIITSYEIYKYKYVCKYCGSDDIKHDSLAVWNEDIQKFELSTIFDAEFCEQCEGETKTKIQYL
ncbi:hypothetical protein HN014_22370 (plasmid) [Aquimarina sp. TRL1]|uniref:hypothetical protein n=1 Tax=Aquimarina sp. (strain TRL1) TaxID=2736252 RepID=UPI0015884137|nr:hypothetical protein [Aquimarina sp. TRL1]QKX07747.1 hypothetical protein HN014_22370 [Aquimarina sp. TRL1]